MSETKKPTAPASVFETLSAINCNEHKEEKNGLSFLSWSWAWHICKKHYPDASYFIYENPDGRPYFDDGRTCWVKTGVTINGQEHIEYLPVMDYNNKSIPLQRVTSTDMNKAIQRSLTKAIARHGLGLYIYAGEDLPDALDDQKRDEVEKEVEKQDKRAAAEKKLKAASQPKKPLPQRGSDEWNNWVNAINTGWKSKTGKSAVEVFARTYDADEITMQDVIGLLEEDAFNARIDNKKQDLI